MKQKATFRQIEAIKGLREQISEVEFEAIKKKLKIKKDIKDLTVFKCSTLIGTIIAQINQTKMVQKSNSAEFEKYEDSSEELDAILKRFRKNMRDYKRSVGDAEY